MVDAGDQKPADTVSLTGPVERIDGELTLRIPLAAGGAALAPAAARIGTVDEKYLSIVIKPWLAEQLGISEGSLVDIDNIDGRFNIRTVATLRLSLDREDNRPMEAAGRQPGDVAERLVAALAKCLAPRLPQTFSLEGRDGHLLVRHQEAVVGGTAVGLLLEGVGKSPMQIASVALSALSDVQDAIALELRTPWPGEARQQPMPSVRVVDERLYLWFGDDRSPVMMFEPLALSEVIRR
jgi:hypothetical protein